MNPPLSATSREASASVLTEARLAPFPRWAGAAVFSPLVASYSLGLDAGSFVQLLHGTGAPFVVVGALVFLCALFSLSRWGLRFMLSKKHPHEPWLWEQTWRRELRDQQWVRLLVAWPILLFLVAFIAALHWMLYKEAFRQGHVLPGALLGLVLLVFDATIFMNVLRPTVLGTLALLRCGRMRLHLPGVPLELGTHCQVHLEAQPGLTHLSDVKVELRRVREWEETMGSGDDQGIQLVTHIEHSHAYTVDAAALREGRDLALALKLPEGGPEHSTALHATRRCHWELKLSSEVPGVDLDITFVLPVYYAVGGHPALAS
ncbi:hypothetical protein [Cystobacter ferrugineus]|uniref:Uncharacterized protein n=1 Tax=Cystobacter ferrugineus TaxID=83449 RepID=A0A1L9BGN0_9BACT|nr:hypothetical protein [Cystobacter ferrugineus]OJH41432.1 hypothetical protein BON30_11295 [Cystobacter ferrugineus]